ncbi:twin-arginine translocase subunit TatC [Klugiella xanthotipulae]|nr:twin-arginine translocase subunit TatC [Klugiella xanthotipulae]
MSLGAHLVELRKRLFRIAIAVILGMVVGWLLSDFVWGQLRQPILDISRIQNRDAQINYTDITSAFDLKLQISLVIGIIVSSPVWLYQIWAFLAPGLTGKEKRYGVFFVIAAIPLFFAGCYAGWYVLPNIVRLMTSFAPAEDAAFISARTYFDFALRLVVVVGVAFVVPVLLVLLNFVGILSARSIIKSWRMAILIIIMFTAIATPAADVMSMFFLAVPMVVLYFLSAGITYLHDRRVKKKQDAILSEYENLAL